MTTADTTAACQSAEATPAPRESLSLGAGAHVLSSILSIGMGLLTSVILARALGPEYKGRVDLVIASIGLGANLFGFSLISGVVYVVARGRDVLVGRLAAILTVLSFFQALPVLLVLYLLRPTRLFAAFVPAEYAGWGEWLVAGGAFVLLLVSYWRALFRGLQRFVAGALLETVIKSLYSAAMIGGVLWYLGRPESGAVAAIVGNAAAYLVVAVLAPIALAKNFRGGNLRGGAGTSQFGDAFRYSVPCYAGNLVQHLNYRMDVFLVSGIVGPAPLGLYALSVSLAQLLWLPGQAMETVVFPRLSSIRDENERLAIAARTARMLFLLTSLMCLGMGVLAPWVVPAVFGRNFAGSVIAVWCLLPGITVFSVSMAFGTYLAAIGKPQLNLVASSCGLVITLIGNLVLLPLVGMVGAAITSTGSYILTTVIITVFFCRHTGAPLWSLLRFEAGDWQLAVQVMRSCVARFKPSGGKKN